LRAQESPWYRERYRLFLPLYRSGAIPGQGRHTRRHRGARRAAKPRNHNEKNVDQRNSA
jgi:hypothetical protein